jgi:hypothetical protein
VPRRVLALACLVVASSAGCGGSSSHGRPAPDLQALLAKPVATPSACGSAQSSATVGRRSPWVGTVDVSVFLDPEAPPAQVSAIGTQLHALAQVQTVYFESAAQAWAEFQRLYTCSADYPRSVVPASYRLRLRTVTRPQRDALVARIRAMSGVASVACDPSSPCLPAG